MVVLKMVIKISICCGKCKMAILKAVTKVGGIDEVSIDAEKDTVTVIGQVDPVCVVKQLRKVRQPACISSVGPNKPPEEKKPELPVCCASCSSSPFILVDNSPGCTIA